MAKRLIDAELARDTATIDLIVHHIDRQPTVDAVEVVRCRDCRWRGSEQCAMFYRCDCGEQHTWETDDDFCSYGERKEG